jgi:hypothetical protein
VAGGQAPGRDAAAALADSEPHRSCRCTMHQNPSRKTSAAKIRPT